MVRTVVDMAIEPDTKDWTWVLEQPCPDCGFEAGAVDVSAMPELVRENVAAWPALLDRPDAAVRPAADRWSALEYACHVRDVFRLFDRRLQLMLEQDDPSFENWDQDETAVADRYGEQDPSVVSRELVDAGDAFAGRWTTVGGDGWGRPGRRSDGSAFTVDSFARYFLHDPIHHLVDVADGYARLDRAG